MRQQLQGSTSVQKNGWEEDCTIWELLTPTLLPGVDDDDDGNDDDDDGVGALDGPALDPVDMLEDMAREVLEASVDDDVMETLLVPALVVVVVALLLLLNTGWLVARDVPAPPVDAFTDEEPALPPPEDGCPTTPLLLLETPAWHTPAVHVSASGQFSPLSHRGRHIPSWHTCVLAQSEGLLHS